jgi:parvulin-like peptidyl-prolyl isomerase
MYKFFLALLLSVSLNAETVDGVAAVVKNSAITIFDVKKEMQTSKVGATQALDNLIRKELEEVEINERKINVTSTEVYDDIKQTAARNNMSVNEFYEAIRESNGLSSTELKEKIRQRLLSQKLYSAIAYSHMSEPDDSEIAEYYELHKKSFSHPSSFTVTVYVTKEKQNLQAKINNPMFYSPEIQTKEEVLKYGQISPELASLLENTPVNTFSAIVPSGKGGYMSFYVKSLETAKEVGLDGVKTQIINLIMGKKREQVLGDYFARLRSNADIKIIRMPK